jgi:hypothetical protein
MIESLDTTNSQKSSMNSFAARTFCSLITCSTYKKNNKNEPCCWSNSFIFTINKPCHSAKSQFANVVYKNEPKPLAADMEGGITKQKRKKKIKN